MKTSCLVMLLLSPTLSFAGSAKVLERFRANERRNEERLAKEKQRARASPVMPVDSSHCEALDVALLVPLVAPDRRVSEPSYVAEARSVSLHLEVLAPVVDDVVLPSVREWSSSVSLTIETPEQWLHFMGAAGRLSLRDGKLELADLVLIEVRPPSRSGAKELCFTVKHLALPAQFTNP